MILCSLSAGYNIGYFTAETAIQNGTKSSGRTKSYEFPPPSPQEIFDILKILLQLFMGLDCKIPETQDNYKNFKVLRWYNGQVVFSRNGL